MTLFKSRAAHTVCMLGYSQSAIVKWCVTGRVKAFLVSGKYLIPKICLVDYLMSADAMCVRQKSFRHELLLKEFVDNMEGNSSK